MDKGVYIALIILCVLVILVVSYFLILKITRKIGRLPIKGLVMLLILLVGILVAVYYYGFAGDRHGMQNGNESEGTGSDQNGEDISAPEMPENSILLRNDEVWIDRKRVDSFQMEEKIKEYLEPRINEAVVVTIIDEYSSSRLVKEVEEIFRQKNLEKGRSYRLETR